jgi:hypothetical protein
MLFTCHCILTCSLLSAPLERLPVCPALGTARCCWLELRQASGMRPLGWLLCRWYACLRLTPQLLLLLLLHNTNNFLLPSTNSPGHCRYSCCCCFCCCWVLLHVVLLQLL